MSRQGEDFRLVILPWLIALQYQGKELFKIEVGELGSVSEEKLSQLVGDAVVRAWKSTRGTHGTPGRFG